MNLRPPVASAAGANAAAAGAVARKQKRAPSQPPVVAPLPDDASVAGEEDPGAALDDSGVAPLTLPKPEP